MFQATTSRMPAKAASGTCTASGAASSSTSSSAAACTMPATGLVAPARMLVTVRAMVPVAGRPPNNGAARLAMPWAISSWLGSWRGRSGVSLSATRAHSSDSIAPSSASVSVGITSWRMPAQCMSGQASGGRARGMPPKRLPMVSSGRASPAVASVAPASAMTVPGSSAIARRQPVSGRSAAMFLGQSSTTAMQATAIAGAAGFSVAAWSATAPIWPKKSAGIWAIRNPSRSFSWASAISTAMPLVKPVTMATGI
mmetsp:Transcript_7068/g.30132  ORF Transcript_7068/g.30132 Transcript_7068/m.30132 type:complete len:255 (+) Transcript_7068:2592-3356(+)